jgi:uncharacterized protein YjaG (DUF416 family)
MNYKEFASTFKKQIFNLTYENQLAFALTISKRLFFDYQRFYEVYRWGSADILLDAINLCEQARSIPIVAIQIKEMMDRVDSITPDMDDFGDEVGSYALNACAAVYNTLEFLIDKDPIHIYNIGTFFTDTIDFRVQEEDDLPEEQIDSHPLMIQARNFLLEQTN